MQFGRTHTSVGRDDAGCVLGACYHPSISESPPAELIMGISSGRVSTSEARSLP